MNIYEQLNKINDAESLSEKYNVKNAKELKKLKESYKSRKCLKEDYEIDGKQVSWPEYFAYRMEEDEYFMEDNLFQEFADKAYQLVEAKGFTDVFTEPSTQMGRGGDFFWAKKDGINYRGVFDFETEQEYFYEAASSANSFDEAIDNLAECYAYIIINNLKPADDEEDFEESLKEDAHNSSKSTKDLVDAAKQIIADLESKGFVNSDIAAIGTMIKETIDSRYPEYVPPMDRLRKKFPDLNI